jgi:hypothetical protein
MAINLARVTKAIAAAKNDAERQDDKLGYRFDDIQVYVGKQASEYNSECVVVGDWNDITKYNPITRQSEIVCNLPRRLEKVLEKLSCELEWPDATCACSDCNKLVSTTPDSFGWTPRYVLGDAELLCLECAEEKKEADELEVSECDMCGPDVECECDDGNEVT